MWRRGKVDLKRVGRGRFRAVEKCSDQSDEDYMVDNDEETEESEDEYVSSSEDETEDSLGEFEVEEEDEVEEEEQFVEKKVKKVGQPKICIENRKANDLVMLGKKKIPSRKKTNYESDEYNGGKRSGIRKPAKNKRYPYRRQESGIWDGLHEYCRGQRNEAVKPRKKRRVSYTEEDIGICDDTDDNDDEEFTPDEVDDYIDDDDYIDVEDEVIDLNMNKQLSRPRKQGVRNSRGQHRRRNCHKLKKNKRKRSGNKQSVTKKKRRKLDHGTAVKQKKLKTTRGPQRINSILNSDSEFELEYDYTFSEEKSEAKEFRKDTLRSSAPVRKAPIIRQESVQPLTKNSGKKGKEKVASSKTETEKQICGICFSEEGKRTVRGVLNCCSHYFCFACIIEWSKVESRCPICKQRFITITKSARADALFDLRTCTIKVPERDQVYQPSEEELRGYLDPYENVICTECHQGGDDALMLLCDICDSPAHTYCVGLSYVVPEGDWYCNGCRPMAIDSLNSQSVNPNLGSSPMAGTSEPFDLNEAYVPDTPPLSNGNEQSSQRLSVGHFPSSSPPGPGSGAATVHERRRIQNRVRHMFSVRRQPDNGSIPSVSGTRQWRQGDQYMPF